MEQFRSKLKLEAKGQLYDILLAIGQQILDYHNPCDWRYGKCRRMRSSKEDGGCCEGCKHLGLKGCTVESLACRLWLCESQRDMFRECEIELKVLRQLADYCGVPYEIRKSKEENFTLPSQPVP
jgi:hypothetical protein